MYEIDNLPLNEAMSVLPYIVGAIVAILMYALVVKIRRPKGRDEMSREERRNKYVQRHVSDLITDVLEEAVEKGTLSRKEVQDQYRKLARMLGTADLLPRRPSSKELKERIKSRIPDAEAKLRALQRANGRSNKKKAFLQKLVS